jgi:HEAT repeat protein
MTEAARSLPRSKTAAGFNHSLTDLFNRSEDAEVRAVCVAALTEFAEDLLTPQPLVDALSDPDPTVAMQGIFALAYFPVAQTVESLCRFIESKVDISFKESAMGQLGKLGDPRAIPTLVKVLLHTDNENLESMKNDPAMTVRQRANSRMRKPTRS